MLGLPLTFTAPLVLAALASLPAIWLLLRVTRRRSRAHRLSALRILADCWPARDASAHAVVAAGPAPGHCRAGDQSPPPAAVEPLRQRRRRPQGPLLIVLDNGLHAARLARTRRPGGGEIAAARKAAPSPSSPRPTARPASRRASRRPRWSGSTPVPARTRPTGGCCCRRWKPSRRQPRGRDRVDQRRHVHRRRPGLRRRLKQKRRRAGADHPPQSRAPWRWRSAARINTTAGLDGAPDPRRSQWPRRGARSPLDLGPAARRHPLRLPAAAMRPRHGSTCRSRSATPWPASRSPTRTRPAR